MASSVGMVVIGRNEGARLADALDSIDSSVPTVYVDSKSSDNSMEIARERDVMIVDLADEPKLSAALARNRGFAALMEAYPDLDYVQFMDGDCLLVEGWLERGMRELDADPGLVALFGDTLERYPEASLFNELCALEWKSAPSERPLFAGITLMRTDWMKKLGGYDPSVIAGEDSEFSVRIWLEGGTIRHLPEPMVVHDADIHTVSQWLSRTIRSGHAIAQRSAINGESELADCMDQRRSLLIWGICLPLISLFLVLFIGPWSLLVLLTGYGYLGFRIAQYRRATFGEKRREATLYAFFTTAAKLPQLYGYALYHLRQWRGGSTIIEHK